MSDLNLKVLVVEDNVTDQQTLVYLLTRKLGCQVETANDGLECLDKLTRLRFDLVFLDLMMPLLSGEEVLREIRACPETKDLSIVVVSAKADQQTIAAVLKLGVFDYVLKPYDKDAIAKRLSKSMGKLKEDLASAVDFSSENRVDQDGRPVLLVCDADNNFRHFAASALTDRYNVLLAANSGQALSILSKHRPRVVLAGAKLGVMGRENLFRKLRATKHFEKAKYYAIESDPKQIPATEAALVDGIVLRSFVTDLFLKSFDELGVAPVVQTTGKSHFVDQMGECLVSAIEQVFGMMMATEVSQSEEPFEFAADASILVGHVAITGYEEEKELSLRFHCDAACIDLMAKRMLGDEENDDNKELVFSTLQEVMNITGGRLKNALDEQNRNYSLGLPKVEEMPVATIKLDHGTKLYFKGEAGIKFILLMSVSTCAKTKISKAELTTGLRVAEVLTLDGDEPLGKGVEITEALLARLQNAGPDEIEIFKAA